MERFTFFWSGPFSQWAPSSFKIDGVTYGCAEQYMMAEKARLFKDKETVAKIMASSDPSDQKRFGRLVRGFNQQTWENRARDIVTAGSRAKYGQNEDYRKALLATAGTTLVEASPHDRVWGIGLSKDDPRAQRRETWLGKNWLGEVLTKVREEILDAKV